MMHNEGIYVEKVNKCIICDSNGMPFYINMRDRLFETPGLWSLYQCSKCGLVWLNPQPLSKEVKKLYNNYYTHSEENRIPRFYSIRKKIKYSILASVFDYKSLAVGQTTRLIGKSLSLLPPIKRTVERGIRGLEALEKGKLLDIGCGNGKFLSMMWDLGWEVQGIEPDTQAARIAKEHFGVKVVATTLEEAKISDNSFDAITMSHVLEHVADPIALLKECYRVLKPAGRLVIIVPNIESFGHKIFKKSWLGLDPPRHLYIFSLRTLECCAEQAGFQVEKLYTMPQMASWMWITSKLIQHIGKFSEDNITNWQRIEGKLFRVVEELAWILWKNVGEEIILIGTKRKIPGSPNQQ